MTLLLTKPNASYNGRYYSFKDVTIDPRPPRMPPMWVSGGSRIPDPNEHDVPVIAKTVMDRIVKAGNWLSRCSGKQEWVKRDWLQLQEHARRLGRDPRSITFGHCNFIHLVEEKNHDKALAKSKAPYVRAMGTHRSYEHLQECYMVGSIDHINARIQDLVDAGLKYLVLGPVTDDPRQIDLLAKRVMSAFRVAVDGDTCYHRRDALPRRSGRRPAAPRSRWRRPPSRAPSRWPRSSIVSRRPWSPSRR